MFSYACPHFSFGKRPIQILSPFYNWITYLFLLSWKFYFIFLTYSGYTSFIRDTLFKYLLPFCGFHFLNGVLCGTKVFNFDVIHFIIIFLFVMCAFVVRAKKKKKTTTKKRLIQDHHHLLKRWFFPHWMVLVPMLKISRSQLCGLYLDCQFYSIDTHVCPWARSSPSWLMLLWSYFETRKFESFHFVLSFQYRLVYSGLLVILYELESAYHLL